MNEITSDSLNPVDDNEKIMRIERYLEADDSLTQGELKLKYRIAIYNAFLKVLYEQIDKVKQEKISDLKQVYGDNLNFSPSKEGGV